MNNRKRIALLIILVFIAAIVILRMLQANGNIKKNDIINAFNNNKGKFFNVQKYADSVIGNLYVDIRDANFNKNNYTEDIVYLLDELNYVGIYEDENADTIKFVIKSREFEQGIIYIKSNIKEDISPSMGSCEKIIDNWFYYSLFHTYVE
jgi:hypothetical protein